MTVMYPGKSWEILGELGLQNSFKGNVILKKTFLYTVLSSLFLFKVVVCQKKPLRCSIPVLYGHEIFVSPHHFEMNS